MSNDKKIFDNIIPNNNLKEANNSYQSRVEKVELKEKEIQEIKGKEDND